MPRATVDGMDVVAIAQTVIDAVDHTRLGEGPSLIGCKIGRFRENGEFDIDSRY